MLRFFVLLLIAANGLYFVWTEGWLRTQGFAPAPQRETLRVVQQIRPEAVQVLSPAELKKVQGQVQSDQEVRHCLQAGPLDTPQVAALDRALSAALPSGGWQFESVALSDRWIVYMGKFANTDALEKKRAELANLKLVPQPLKNPSLELGLSLGGFDTQAAANDALTKLSGRGIRTARVVQERVASNATFLKLPAVTDTQKARLNDVRSALAGQSLKNCN